MPDEIVLLDLENRDIDYVAKGKANNAALRDKINSLLALSGGGRGLLSFTLLLDALFNGSPVLVGYDSYSCGGSGATLAVQPGSAWKPSIAAVVQSATPVDIDFTGQPAATYYLAIDAAGAPSRTTDGSEPYYSIVWDGAAFGAITRLANCFMVAAEEQALLHSTERSMDFATLLARLESDEAEIAAAGGAAWGAITGTLSAQTDLQSALDLKAPLVSPALTASPTAPTQSPGDNSTKLATTAYVAAALAAAGVTIPGPYADDTAAATAGVALHSPYYLTTSGYVVVRTV